MNWLTVSAFGGIVGVDATSFAQTMISRPLMAATITGFLMGRPTEGLFLGSLLELFAIVILPVGAARYPETGTAGVAATAAYMSATPLLSPSVALLAVLFSLLWEQVAGRSVVLSRRFNESFVKFDAAEAAPDRAFEWRHRAAIIIDYVRAFLVTLAGTAIGTLAIRGLSQFWNLGASVAPAILSIGICCMVAAVLPLFGGFRAQKVAFGVGVACGLLILLLQ
jgi:mannose/fructose/N-acetylgalactosamine-specific phosphotransferase system component IIC